MHAHNQHEEQKGNNRNIAPKRLPQRRDRPDKRLKTTVFSQVKGRYRFSQTQAIRIKHAPELRFFINSY